MPNDSSIFEKNAVSTWRREASGITPYRPKVSYLQKDEKAFLEYHKYYQLSTVTNAGVNKNIKNSNKTPSPERQNR